MKILVVDDSKAMRMIVMRFLRTTAAYAAADMVEAENGKTALEAVGTEQPDIILCDWNMPEMSGIEFLEQLRAGGSTVPFGFITSESTPEMYRRAMTTGAQFFVSKPFTAEVLEQALARAA
jgi:two-component system, chemotaxis family, chemotaxis protein CheY